MNTTAPRTASPPGKEPVTTYHEVMVGKTLFRVTSVYRGQIELREALENLTVSKALQAPDAPMEAYG